MNSLMPPGAVNPHGLASSTPLRDLQLKAGSMRDALLFGIVTGFALAAGNLIFRKLAKWRRWD